MRDKELHLLLLSTNDNLYLKRRVESQHLIRLAKEWPQRESSSRSQQVFLEFDERLLSISNWQAHVLLLEQMQHHSRQNLDTTNSWERKYGNSPTCFRFSASLSSSPKSKQTLTAKTFSAVNVRKSRNRRNQEKVFQKKLSTLELISRLEEYSPPLKYNKSVDECPYHLSQDILIVSSQMLGIRDKRDGKRIRWKCRQISQEPTNVLHQLLLHLPKYIYSNHFVHHLRSRNCETIRSKNYSPRSLTLEWEHKFPKRRRNKKS